MSSYILADRVTLSTALLPPSATIIHRTPPLPVPNPPIILPILESQLVMWRTWQLCPIRSERKQGRHHQLIPWTILLFVAPFHLYPPPPPCQSFFTYRLPPSHETPCPSLSAHQWGAEKLLFRRTKYSSCWSQECKQQGTAEHNSNPPGFRVVSGNFLSPHNKQNTISRLSVL